MTTTPNPVDKRLSQDEYAPWLRPQWWTVRDAANVICGYHPINDFDKRIQTGGDRALLYFELKNLSVAEGHPPNPDSRIRPALALRVAKALGINLPSKLVPLLRRDEEALGAVSSSQAHISKKLAALYVAAEKFWKNAVPNESDTHAKNDDVAEWLETQGFSSSLASKAASIVRPEWAAEGRPPK